MADEVLSQAAIDAMMAANAAGNGGASSDTKEKPVKDKKKDKQEKKAAKEESKPPAAPQKEVEPEPVKEPEPIEAKTPEPVVAPAAENKPDPEPPKDPIAAAQKEAAPEPAKTSEPIAPEPVVAPAAENKSESEPLKEMSPAKEIAPAIASVDLEQVLRPLQSAVDDLNRRTVSTEVVIQKINSLESDLAATRVELLSQNSNQAVAKVIQLEAKMMEINNTIQILMANMENVLNLMEDTKGQMKDITKSMDATFGYNIRETYECRNCGSQGYVLGLVKCSDCGDEDWWGWWPPEDCDEYYEDDPEFVEAFAGEENHW